jgi:hypothetical protein
MLTDYFGTLSQIAQSFEKLSMAQLFSFRTVQFSEGAGGVALEVNHAVMEHVGGPPLLNIAFDEKLKAWKYNSWVIKADSDAQAIRDFQHLSEASWKNFVPWAIFGLTSACSIYIESLTPEQTSRSAPMVGFMFLGFSLGVSELLKLSEIKDNQEFSVMCLRKSAHHLARLIGSDIDEYLEGDSLDALLSLSELFRHIGVWVDPEIRL